MKKLATIVLLAAIVASGTLNAQEMNFKSHNSNPWGLVYDGAITENIQGKVNIHPITYDLNGLKISANFGFSSPAYFSRYVQQNLGMKPSDYRD